MGLLPTNLLDDILPIFVVASIGFLLARRLHVDVKSLSRVTFNALAPCMVFSLLVSSRVSSGEFGRIVAFTVLLVAAIGLVARAAATSPQTAGTRTSPRSAARPPRCPREARNVPTVYISSALVTKYTAARARTSRPNAKSTTDRP